MTRARLMTLTMIVLAVAACGARSTQGSGGSSSVEITSEEIRASSHADAFSLIQAMRPGWLRVRGATSIRGTEEVHVYMDGLRLGGVGQLRQLTTGSILSIRFLNGLEATQRWGLDHGSGAIVITTRS